MLTKIAVLNLLRANLTFILVQSTQVNIPGKDAAGSAKSLFIYLLYKPYRNDRSCMVKPSVTNKHWFFAVHY